MSETNPIVTAYQGGVGELGVSTPEQARLAQLAVARYALGTDAPYEATADLLAMLGLDGAHTARRCQACDREMSRSAGCGRPYPGADGVCQPCHRREAR